MPESPTDLFRFHYRGVIVPALNRNRMLLADRSRFWLFASIGIAVIGFGLLFFTAAATVNLSWNEFDSVVLGIVLLAVAVSIALEIAVGKWVTPVETIGVVRDHVARYRGWTNATLEEKPINPFYARFSLRTDGYLERWSSRWSIATGEAPIHIYDALLAIYDTERPQTYFEGTVIYTDARIDPGFELSIVGAADGTRLWAGIPRQLAGSEKLEPADAAFNRRFVVRSNDADFARSWLTAERTAAIRRFADKVECLRDPDPCKIAIVVHRSILFVALDLRGYLLPTDFNYRDADKAVPLVLDALTIVDHATDRLLPVLRGTGLQTASHSGALHDA